MLSRVELVTKNRTKEKCGKGNQAAKRASKEEGGKIVQSLVDADSVVEQDVSANGIFGLLTRSEALSVQSFALEGL